MVRTLINPGDEVLIPEPCFVCYRPCTVMAGGVPVPIETKEEDNFRLLPEQLKEKITDKTKLLILPYPNNPTGGIMSKEDLEAIAEVLRGTNKWYCQTRFMLNFVMTAKSIFRFQILRV